MKQTQQISRGWGYQGQFPKICQAVNIISSLVGGFNPFEQILVNMGIFPQIGVNMNNIWNHHPEYHIFPYYTYSGQAIIFHQFQGLSLTKPPVGVRSCEVAKFWPDILC